VARLLAAGHTVHATWRAAGDDAAAQAALQELPGAAERLHWFPADLMQAGSFDAAVAGCK
jgi:NAD(P)-dependent dehydrogenase (short-subunit alcohol dehydrogenase family)